MAWKKKFDPIIYKRSQVILSVVLMIILLLVGIFLWRVTHKDTVVQVQTTEIAGTFPEEFIEPEEASIEERQGFDAELVAAALNEWSQSINGRAGVVVTDAYDGSVLATFDPDQQFFAASIYKLYVAYEGYKQIDEGLVDLSEQYLNGFTRGECLDKMIRESDSPCAEKLWVELGKQETTDILRTYGMNNTSMTGITTTAADAAIMLSRIANGEGLSEQSQTLFLQSMKDQVFRDTLNKSFIEPEYVVYNKIGFNELQEYHDVAIIELPETDRKLVISVMTDGVGTSNIVRLGETLKKAIPIE